MLEESLFTALQPLDGLTSGNDNDPLATLEGTILELFKTREELLARDRTGQSLDVWCWTAKRLQGLRKSEDGVWATLDWREQPFAVWQTRAEILREIAEMEAPFWSELAWLDPGS
jgi:hypothetical protein